jgi:hypothetical protein
MSEAQQLVVYYPDLSRGWGPTAPPRSLGPDGARIWRDTRNMWAYDGLLRRCPAAISAGFAAAPAPGVTFSSASIHDGECPVFIHTDTYPSGAARTTTASACSNEFDYNVGSKLIVLVTNRQAYISNDGGTTWRNVTPTYSTGTVTATNGTVNVTGAGTAWTTRGISPYQIIVLDGLAYQVCAVTSDTALTLTTAYAGATGAGKAYSIRRTWRGGLTLDRSSLIFCKIYNQNLYIAGTFIGRADGEIRPTVIRVSDILSATPVSEYLTSTFDLTGTLDLIAAPILTDITGLQILQDSRLVLSGSDSTLYYSSNLDQAVWSVSPGGFTVDTQVDGPIHALGMIGNVLTAHHQDGITLCYPQAQSDPPLALQRSQAQAGCFAPRTLCSASGVERYLGADGQVYQFDLSTAQPIGDDIRNELRGASKAMLREAAHATFRSYRDEYFLFVEDYPRTDVYVFQARQGQWWTWELQYPVTAMSTRNDASATVGAGFCLIGVSNLDEIEAVPGTYEVVDLLWAWSEVVAEDTLDTYVGESDPSGYVYAQTDEIDLGNPLQLKSVQRVIIWFRGAADTTETVAVSVAQDGSIVETVIRTALPIDSSYEIPYQFCFVESAGTAPIIRIRSVTGDGFKALPTRMMVIMEAAGSIEDVSL